MPEIITYTSGDATIRAEHYGTPGRRTAVLAHGSDGVTDNLNGPWATTMRGFAETLAARGVYVLLPYYFDKTGTDPGPAAMQTMFAHMAAWQQAIADAAEFGGGRIALVGFSLGGHLSLRLRDAVPVVVAVSAPLLTGLGPAVLGARTRVQIHHGDADRLVDAGNADQIAGVLSAEGLTAEVYRYPDAGHGFSGAKPGDAEALRLSRERTVAFVTANL